MLPCTYLRACICRAARAVRSRPSRARRRTFTFRGPARPNVYTFVRKTTTFAHVHVYGCVFVVPPTFGLAVSRFEPRRRRTIDRFRQQRTVRSAAPGDDFVSTPSDARRSHAAVGITEVYPSASRKYASKENVLFIYACTVPSLGERSAQSLSGDFPDLLDYARSVRPSRFLLTGNATRSRRIFRSSNARTREYDESDTLGPFPKRVVQGPPKLPPASALAQNLLTGVRPRPFWGG